MNRPVLFSLIESPTHPKLSALYKDLDIEEIQFNSVRKLLAALKKSKPDFIVAEFFYAYGSNYSGIHISNLDMMLITLQKYSLQPKTIVFVQKQEKEFIGKLEALYKVDQVFIHPVAVDSIRSILADYLDQ